MLLWQLTGHDRLQATQVLHTTLTVYLQYCVTALCACRLATSGQRVLRDITEDFCWHIVAKKVQVRHQWLDCL